MGIGNRRVGLLVVLALFATSAGCTAGGQARTKVQIGEKMAAFTLPDVANGQPRSLDEFKGKKAVVVIFIATQCPYSNAFTGVMARLAREYAGRGVAFVGVNANKTEPTAEVAEHAQVMDCILRLSENERRHHSRHKGKEDKPAKLRLDFEIPHYVTSLRSEPCGSP